ncbi:hypothetical protein Tco_0088154 [Tanacetum coccineum]
MLYGSECWPITKALAKRVEGRELGKFLIRRLDEGCRGWVLSWFGLLSLPARFAAALMFINFTWCLYVLFALLLCFASSFLALPATVAGVLSCFVSIVLVCFHVLYVWPACMLLLSFGNAAAFFWYRCARKELITPDLTCPSTHQLLWNSSDDSGPNLSFDKSASPKRLFSLARFSLAETSKLDLSFRWFRGDYTSSCPPSLVHISQLVPLGLNKVVSFKVVCRDLNIVPTVTLFRVFQCLFKQGDWFSFSKRCNVEDVCIDDGPSSLKKWKDKFFLIDRRAIPDYLTWRHSCSCVSDDLPTDGYDRNDVERLCARLICLREMREEVLVRSGLSFVWFNKECDPVFQRIDDNAEMSIYDFMTLPSWSDAKVVEESHRLSLPLLERVPSHTTAPAAEGAIILLLTLDEIDASLADSCLAKKSKGPS